MLYLLQVIFSDFAVNIEHFVELAALNLGLLADGLALVHEILVHLLWIDVLFKAAFGNAAILSPVFAAMQVATVAATSSILALKLALLHSILHLAIHNTHTTRRHQKALRVNIDFAAELRGDDKLPGLFVVALDFDAVDDAEFFIGTWLVTLFCPRVFALKQTLLDLVGVDSVTVHVDKVTFAVATTIYISLRYIHYEPAIRIIAAFHSLPILVVRPKFVVLRLHKPLLLHVTPLLLAVGDFATADTVSIPVEKVPLRIAPRVRVLSAEARLRPSIGLID